MSFPAAVTQEMSAIRPSRKFEGRSDSVMGVIHLPGGQQMITATWDGSLQVWDLQTGKQIGNDWQDGGDDVFTIALSLDGKKVASGSEDGAVRLWDVDPGKVIAKWVGHMTRVYCVCWSRDGGRVVSGAENDGTARVWDVESGKTVLAIDTGFSHVYAVIYSPDTTMIATGGDEEPLKVWDAKTGTLVANLKGHTSKVECLAWTANGKTLISGSADYSIRTWNTITWQQIAVWTGHTETVWGIAISPNGRILASASGDNTARLWNLETGQPIGSPLQHEDNVWCTSFSTDGMLLATGSGENAYTWDVSAVVKEADLSELLLNSNEKSAAGATRPQGDWRRNPYPGPSNDTLRHPPLPGRSSSSARQQYISPHPSSHGLTPPGPIPSQSRGNDNKVGGLPTQPRFLQWARRNTFFNTRNSRIREGSELQKGRTEVVDVPLAQRTLRNASARGVRIAREKEKARKAEVAKAAERQKAGDAENAGSALAVVSSSRPSETNVNPQPIEGAQAQPTPGLHSAGVSVSPTPPTATAFIVTTRWARFWSAACCMHVQNVNDHH